MTHPIGGPIEQADASDDLRGLGPRQGVRRSRRRGAGGVDGRLGNENGVVDGAWG